MKINLMPGDDTCDRHLELNLTKEELENIVKGRYPSGLFMVKDHRIIVSVGLDA